MIDTYPKLHFQLVIFAKLFVTLIQIKRVDMTISVFGCRKFVMTVNKPLELILKKALITGTYASDWKRDNTVPVQKKAISRILKTTA